MSDVSLPRRIFRALWNGLTRLRLAMANIFFLIAIALIYFVYIGGAQQPLPERAALLLNMTGVVVDQKSPVEPLGAVLGEPSAAEHEVLLRTVIDTIEIAAEDPAISALVMELDNLVYVGISRTQEIVRALETFRASGKPIIAMGDYYTQDQYLLASHADEIIVHPLGGVALEGFSSYRNYFRSALEKLSVSIHIFKAGEHKSAVEPLVRDDMSPEEKAVTARWLGDLWGQYTAMVETERGLDAGAVTAYANEFPERLRSEGGDAATAALEAGLVDRLMQRAEANEYLIEVVGAEDEDGLYEAVVFERYALRKQRPQSEAVDRGRVAVITASGNILPGDQPAGVIGGDSTARLIRGAAEDEDTDAIVLRINSGGGSMFASEVIRQQVLFARSRAIPVVVSMGSVAASGGYYIAAPADEIWATPTTITGSIGVFAAFPTFENLLERIGVSTDGVGTTAIAGSLRPDRPLEPALVDALNSGIEFAYRTFLDVVAEGRGMDVEDVEPLAEGRVWSASDALKGGLVDRVGSLEDAIASAAALADMTDYEVKYVELPLSPRDLIMKQLANRFGQVGSAGGATLSTLLSPLQAAVEELAVLQDPRHLYFRCLDCGSGL